MMNDNGLGPDYDQEFNFKKHSDKLRLKFLQYCNVFALAWVLWALFCLSLLAGAIYVAVHFISKFW